MVTTLPAGNAPARRLRLAGAALLALGIAGYMLPRFHAISGFAGLLRDAAPYIVLLGAALLLFSVLVRPRREAAAPLTEIEPTYFGRDTTEFADVSPPGDEAQEPRPPPPAAPPRPPS